MRILFVSKDFLPAIGGISLMVHGLAEACNTLGHDVTVLAPGIRDEADTLRSYATMRDARPYPGDGNRLGWLRYTHGTARKVRRVVEDLKPDAIVLGVYLVYGDACVRAGKALGIPVGGLVHGFDVLSALRRRRTAVRRLAGRLVGFPSSREHVLTYVRQADRIFANSSTTSTHVRQNSGRKPIVIGCGVPESLASAAIGMEKARVQCSATRARLRLPDAPTVGFVGRLVARKNVESIVRSLEEMPACQALIVGDGPMRRSLQALAGELGVSERAHFVGEVEEHVKQECIRAMDVFCLPSREIGGYDIEGFGIVLLEATAAGVPVVGGRSGGIPDVIEHERTGLLADPEDWRDVAGCLRRMLEDRELAARCVSAAQAQLRGGFNWTSIARRVVGELRDASRETRGTRKS